MTLCIHIARRVTRNGRQVKDDRHLPFPTSGWQPPGGSKRYTLQAVAVRIGRHVTAGHYVAYIRQGRSWYLCDDSVKPLEVTLQSVKRSKAYILFYQQDGV